MPETRVRIGRGGWLLFGAHGLSGLGAGPFIAFGAIYQRQLGAGALDIRWLAAGGVVVGGLWDWGGGGGGGAGGDAGDAAGHPARGGPRSTQDGDRRLAARGPGAA